MQIKIHKTKDDHVAEIISDEVLIKSEQDALDLMANVSYREDTRKIILQKEQLSQDFFILSTGLAGDILQKFSNYRVKLAVIGDFSNISSKSLRDFIFESNKGGHILFLADLNEALKGLTER